MCAKVSVRYLTVFCILKPIWTNKSISFSYLNSDTSFGSLSKDMGFEIKQWFSLSDRKGGVASLFLYKHYPQLFNRTWQGFNPVPQNVSNCLKINLLKLRLWTHCLNYQSDVPELSANATDKGVTTQTLPKKYTYMWFKNETFSGYSVTNPTDNPFVKCLRAESKRVRIQACQHKPLPSPFPHWRLEEQRPLGLVGQRGGEDGG